MISYEPKLNDIGVRPRKTFRALEYSSEPSWIDIGVRRRDEFDSAIKCSEPSWIDIILDWNHRLKLVENNDVAQW